MTPKEVKKQKSREQLCGFIPSAVDHLGLSGEQIWKLKLSSPCSPKEKFGGRIMAELGRSSSSKVVGDNRVAIFG
jgi:hypothetical protein